MTSTEFTVGIGEGARVSSKVLKPPGGGSSDIFGVGGGSSCAVAGKPSCEKSSEDSSTHSRVFGVTELPPPPVKNLPLHQSSIFENGAQPPPAPKQQSSKKVFVRRNPITGMETEITMETENSKNVCDNEPPKEESAEPPNKPVHCSIRVRNPPGGKSSGIF